MLEQQEKSEYDIYLEQIHSKLNTPEEVLQEVVAKNVKGNHFIERRRIVAGEVNEVYELVLEDKSSLIARISRREKPGFDIEKWAIDQCIAFELPVPEIIMIDTIKVDNDNISICLQKMLPGDTLERGKIDIWKMDRKDLHQVIVQAGVLLSKMHKIQTSGFGNIDRSGIGEFQTLHEAFESELKSKLEYFSKKLELGISRKTLLRINTILSNNRSILRSISSRLSHSDYGPKHLMVQKDRVTGIIDFGDVKGHSIINDIAKWDYWYNDNFPTEWLLEGYGMVDEPNYEFLFHLIKLIQGLNAICSYHKNGYASGIKMCLEKWNKDLQYFDIY